MSTTLTIPDVSEQLPQFSLTDSAIAEMAEQYLPLKINGVEDSEGYKIAHDARMDVKAKRVEVEKRRKELKAEALEYGRKIDGRAKQITALLDPIESHLEEEEKAYFAAKEAIRNAARLKAEAAAKEKAEAEAAKLRAEQAAEAERLRVEREKLDAERKAIEAERARVEAEQAAERARQKAEQDKIDAERMAVEAEQKRLAGIEAARLLAIEKERIRQEAAEKARVETEARLAREAAEKAAAEKAKAEAEEAAIMKAEALRPDKQKLLAIALTVAAINVPEVSADANHAAQRVRRVLAGAVEQINVIVDSMSVNKNIW
jgi:hypothetical protein